MTPMVVSPDVDKHASASSTTSVIPEPSCTVWGLTPTQLHDAYWRSKGVQCIRRGQRQIVQRGADLFLLLEPDQLTLFDITSMTDHLTWHNPSVTRLRLMDEAEAAYSEHVVVDAGGHVQRIERRYGAAVRGSSRVMLTRLRRVASTWMNSRSRREGWDRVRRSVAWARVDHQKSVGRTFIAGRAQHEKQLLDDLVVRWVHPSQAITNLQESAPGVWQSTGETTAAPVVRIGPLWLGQGAGGAEQRCIVGPAWTPDRAVAVRESRVAHLRDISDIELPEDPMQATVDIAMPRGTYLFCKRSFDIVVSACALLAFAPIMLAVGLAVWMESGLPFFFGHKRQGRGGRSFSCWKFRTMKRDAHKMARTMADNQCDGPQVYIKNDPRVTAVGRFLRKSNLDELPQFWNVLRGDMSMVGPRPSPDDENQFCPAWRDLRLSVRPGITGLWQLKRTREPGEDFQEWIKYDIEYVQRATFWFDMMILFKTAILVLRRRTSSVAE